MHDIGKFVDRDTLGVTNEYFDNHAGLYQPFFKGRHTHSHAVGTAAFIELLADYLPPQLNDPDWGTGDAFINLAAGHHLPQTPHEWIVAVADRLSSGFDRRRFEEYSEATPWREYKKTRLYPIFEQLELNEDESDRASKRASYAYSLSALSPKSIFPKPSEEIVSITKQDAEQEYQELFEDFTESIGSLAHAKENIALWLEHFDSLMMIFTSFIPSARAGNVGTGRFDLRSQPMHCSSVRRAVLLPLGFTYSQHRGCQRLHGSRNFSLSREISTAFKTLSLRHTVMWLRTVQSSFGEGHLPSRFSRNWQLLLSARRSGCRQRPFF